MGSVLGFMEQIFSMTIQAKKRSITRILQFDSRSSLLGKVWWTKVNLLFASEVTTLSVLYLYFIPSSTLTLPLSKPMLSISGTLLKVFFFFFFFFNTVLPLILTTPYQTGTLVFPG